MCIRKAMMIYVFRIIMTQGYGKLGLNHLQVHFKIRLHYVLYGLFDASFDEFFLSIRETAMLYDPKVSSDVNKVRVATGK
jgi:hypothetical protein